jgi:hypothetical protein
VQSKKKPHHLLKKAGFALSGDRLRVTRHASQEEAIHIGAQEVLCAWLGGARKS